jgi:hypothetical protein
MSLQISGRFSRLGPGLLVLAILVAVALPSAAQLRALPPEAKRGTIRHLESMTVEIDGRIAQLAPGAQIRDPSNRIVLPVALPPGSLVRYTVDGEGKVFRVWILTEFEASQRDPRP